jgi:small subunit ribosomal protein S20
VKRTRSLIAAGRIDEAEAAALEAVRSLDRAAAKGIIHQNKAARSKSRLMKQLNQAREAAA